MLRSALLAIGALAVACTPGPREPRRPPDLWATALDLGSPLVGKIWSPKSGTAVDPSEVFDAIRRADFVLLGEQHDNPDHHRLQAEAIGVLVRAGKKPTVALEMLEPDQDAIVERYRSDPQAQAIGLGAELDWEKSGWPPWRSYRPIADVAFEAGLPFVSANLPHALVRRIVHEGLSALSLDEVARLGLQEPLPPALEASLEDELEKSHCGQLPQRLVVPMALAQRARDGQMADRMLGAKTTPVVLVAGAGHARTDRGVPRTLRAARPRATIVSVAFVEVAHGRTSPAAYAERYDAESLPFDFVWFTPRATDDDPCEGLHVQ